MIKILVLEDNEESLLSLSRIVQELSEEILTIPARSCEEAKKILETEKSIDLFLLDINLNAKKVEDSGGLDVAKWIRQQYEYELTPIVFITSILSMELAAYREIQCHQYITKPFEAHKVQEIVQKILSHAKEPEKEYVVVKQNGVNYKISCEDIMFLKAVPRGLQIYLREENFEVRYLTLKQILPKLPVKDFFQCHRMFIVNRQHIEYADLVNRVIKIKDSEEFIEIGGTYKAKAREWMNG